VPLLQTRMTPEFSHGYCESCRLGPDNLLRYYIEAGDYHGNTQWLCETCRRCEAVSLQAELEEPPRLTGSRPPSRSRRRAVARQERETAELVGGRVQKASGAVLSAKSDVRLKGVLRGEMKSTEKKSFILKREVLDKIRSECVGMEKPFLSLRFINPLTMAAEDEWVVIPIEHWEHNKNATP
jgi:hypothetical protein